MNIFKLPDLGEGLPDAEIHQWYVKVGDTVVLDQPLVSMETAKAIVDVPSPQSGVIVQCFGTAGDIIRTGAPLVAFEAADKGDQGTVVGVLEQSHVVTEDVFTIGAPLERTARIKATPLVRLLAKKQGVILASLTGTGPDGLITAEDVMAAGQVKDALPEGFKPLHGPRRAMVRSMTESHQQVVPVSIFDEASLAAWPEGTDITLRIIRAMLKACATEPALNAWFDGARMASRLFDTVNLGLAVDSDAGLLVPVIANAETLSDAALRSTINAHKIAAAARTLTANDMKDATITLSNFGKFAGRYASPIIVPPAVAILAVGRLYQGVRVDAQKRLQACPLLPLSLTFDHRAVTGGEATRFLGAVIEALEQA
jgi:2-oxoisovalerate dehydrogenase E2 component (dihydrolipoyl transacylase)